MGFFESKPFDASKVEPSNGFDPLPDGSYPCIITKAEEKPTKTPGGLQLVVEFKVTDGKYKGRTLFHRLNLENANPKAVSIGLGQLSALCRACGIVTPRGAHEFANKVVRVTVKVVPDTRPQGGLQNSVTKVEPMGSAAPAAPVAPAADASAAAPWST